MELQSSSSQSAFKNRSLLRLCAGELVSTTGSALTTLAASILIYRLTGSALRVSLLLVATALPSLLVGLAAGVIVDRIDRKRILILSDLARAVLSFSIPFLVSTHYGWLYAVVFLSSAVGQFFNPAHESILADIASDAERAAANSLMALCGFGATMLGFAICGMIASSGSIQWAFYIDALTFVFSALCIRRIFVPLLRRSTRRDLQAVWSDLRSGSRFLAGSTGLRALLVASTPVILAFGLWNSLLLPFTLHTLHASSFDYGLQEGLTTLGFTLGCLVVMRLGDSVRPGRWILISFLGMGTAAVYYAFSASIPLAISLVMVSGLLNAPYSVGRRLVLQRCTEREMRGRINSLFMVTRDAAYLAGMAAAGLADVLSIRWLLAGCGGLFLAGGLLILWLGASRETSTVQWFKVSLTVWRKVRQPAVGAGSPYSVHGSPPG